MIMCQGVLNWTGQLSCLLINSLRKFLGLWRACRSATIWIDKQSPLCTEQLQHSFVFHYPPLSLFLSISSSPTLSSLDKAPARPKKQPLISLHLSVQFFSFVIPTHAHSQSTFPPFFLSFTLAQALSRFPRLCHFVDNDPESERTTASIHLITLIPFFGP